MVNAERAAKGLDMAAQLAECEETLKLTVTVGYNKRGNMMVFCEKSEGVKDMTEFHALPHVKQQLHLIIADIVRRIDTIAHEKDVNGKPANAFWNREDADAIKH